jgi:glycosyltransferase involved in cell wall biosynthesis
MIKHIALISEHASPLAALGGVDCGGQNVYVAQVALALAKRGHHVDVFTRRDDPRQPRIARYAGRVRVIHVDAGPSRPLPKEELLGWMPEFAADAMSFVEEQGLSYDVTHANFFMSGMVAEAFEEAMGTPFVITFHALGRVRRLYQGTADAFPPERELIEQRLVARAACVIAECPQDALDLIAHYHAPANRLTVIPCGVDLERFHPVPRARARQVLGLAEDDRVLAQVGRMVPRKGVDDVIRAVGRLRRDHRMDARLLVVGGDGEEETGRCAPEQRRLRHVAREERVTDLVSFVGRRGGDALRYFYSAADVFVSTPWYEPFGITPLEAMACGTPVIGSAVGGIRYTVVDGETGFLVPPRDPDAIAACAARLFHDEALRRRLSRAGVARVREKFQWSDIAARLDTVYERASSAPASRERVETPDIATARVASAGATSGVGELEA